MIDLLDLRNQLDDIDSQMVDLFEKRMKICQDVARYKIANQKAVFDKEREDQKIKNVVGMAHGELNKQAIEEVYQQLMAISRKLQYQMLQESGVAEEINLTSVDQLDTKDAKVVFQGMKGAYSYAAMHTFFGNKVNSSHVETFRDAMECLKKGDADYAVLPIENSSAGIVNDIFDLLAEYDNYIVGEVTVPVRHVLLGVKGANLSDVKKVYSHPQALMQCKKFLAEHREWEQIPYLNTAAAAAMISDQQDKTKAAIASEIAGECYDLDIIADEIYYSETNSTRFIIVTSQKIFLKDASRISICFEGLHKAGSLYNLLSHLIYNGLSMTKIESRPIEGKDFEYHFFIDMEGNLEDSSVLNALSGLSHEAKNLKILGNY